MGGLERNRYEGGWKIYRKSERGRVEEEVEDAQKEREWRRRRRSGRNEIEDEDGKGEAGWTGPTISPMIVPATPC